MACEKGRGHIVKWFSDNFQLEGIIKEEDLSNSYMMACESTSLLAVQCMYRFRPDLYYDGMFPSEIDIGAAVIAGQPHIIEWLVAEDRSTICLKKMGAKFLVIACSKPKVAVIEALLTSPYVRAKCRELLLDHLAHCFREEKSRRFISLMGIPKVKEFATKEQIEWAENRILTIPRITSWSVLPSFFVRSYLSGRPDRYNPFFKKILRYKPFLDLRKIWVDGLSLLSNQVAKMGVRVKQRGLHYVVELPVLPVEVWINIMEYLCADLDITNPKILAKMVTQEFGCDIGKVISASGVKLAAIEQQKVESRPM